MTAETTYHHGRILQTKEDICRTPGYFQQGVFVNPAKANQLSLTVILYHPATKTIVKSNRRLLVRQASSLSNLRAKPI